MKRIIATMLVVLLCAMLALPVCAEGMETTAPAADDVVVGTTEPAEAPDQISGVTSDSEDVAGTGKDTTVSSDPQGADGATAEYSATTGADEEIEIGSVDIKQYGEEEEAEVEPVEIKQYAEEETGFWAWLKRIWKAILRFFGL